MHKISYYLLIEITNLGKMRISLLLKSSLGIVSDSNNWSMIADKCGATMCIADDLEYDAESMLTDGETWLVFLETAFRNDSTGADTLAHLLFIIKEAIESGPDGVKRAVSTLSYGLRLVYLYTDEHKLALKLYLLYLTGDLRPQDEPLTLLDSEIERGAADIDRAHKRSAAKSKHTGKSRISNRK